MKKIIIIFGILFCTCFSGYSQTNFSDNVAQLWFDGHKSNVLEIANNRLAVNSNDMAGLLMKMAYEITFLLDNDLTNTMNRVMELGPTITSTNFVAEFPAIQADIVAMREMMVLTPLTANELESERAKGYIPRKPFIYYDSLVALEQDGLLP